MTNSNANDDVASAGTQPVLGSLDLVLKSAVIVDDVDLVRKLLASGKTANAIDFEGQTPLYIAVRESSVECIHALIDGGANVNAQVKVVGSSSLPVPSTALHKAIANGRTEHAVALLARGADPNVANEKGDAAFHHLALVEDYHAAGTVEFVQKLLKAGADVSQKNRKGRTPLHVAAGLVPGVGVIELLVESGAQVDARDEGQFAAIHGPWNAETLGALRSLVACGADLECRDSKGRTAIFHATDWQAVHEIISLGGSPHALNNEGVDALAYNAMSVWDAPTINVLLAAGCDPGRVDEKGRSVRDLAAEGNILKASEMSRLLAAHDARQAILGIARSRGPTP